VQLDIGAGYTAPIQLVFVPMLLLLPTPWVPLLVAAGWLLGKLPDLRAGTHPDRLLLQLSNSWFAVGPALVLVLADAQTPDWADWPAYLLALVAQFVLDIVSGELREAHGRGIAFRLQLRVFGLIQGIDALLSPLGLLAAFASESWRYAFLLLIAPAGLFLFYARERAARLSSALALADAARERQELIASASHELVTPLAVLVGLNDRLAPARHQDDDRREQVHAAMTRELVQLRQQVNQFVDYARLKTERDLQLHPQPVAVRPVLDEVATALAAGGGTEVTADPDVTALADPSRLHQMVLSLANAVVRAGPAVAAVSLAATASDGSVDIVVAGGAPEAPVTFEEGQAAGIGLHVTRELALAQGGDVRAEPAGGGGTRYTLTLPRGEGGG
jgi:signal transduction histidine kinase